MDLPATLSTGVMQERVGAPSMCTVHAPHKALPQPNLVPVSPSVSRNTHNKRRVAGDIDILSLTVDRELDHVQSPIRRS